MITIHYRRIDALLVVHHRDDAATVAEVLRRWVDTNGTKLPYDYEPPRRPMREVEQ